MSVYWCNGTVISEGSGGRRGRVRGRGRGEEEKGGIRRNKGNTCTMMHRTE